MARRHAAIVAFWISLVLAVLLGCAGPRRHLSPMGGDMFTLFPEQGSPEPIRCSGNQERRTTCFFAELDDRASGKPVSGALSITPADRRTRSVSYADGMRSNQVTARTMMPAASVTKMFLAAATVSLSLDGTVDLHQPIARYVPELRSDRGPGQVSLHHLMTHTGGVPNLNQCERDHDIDELVRQHRLAPLWAPPGAVYAYSNFGYTLVAAVLERVTHHPFESIVKERVLDPAGIARASFDPNRIELEGHASDTAPPLRLCRALWPSGGLLLGVEDLSRWARDLASPEPALGQAIVRQLTAPHVRTGEGDTFYGYGVVRRSIHGVTLLGHGGGLPGYASYVAWVPERQFGVAAMVNVSGAIPAAASRRALSTLLDLPADLHPDLEPDHELTQYAGTYLDQTGDLGTLRVSLEHGVLVIDYPAGAPKLLPPHFRFAFVERGKPAAYVITPVGIGRRTGS